MEEWNERNLVCKKCGAMESEGAVISNMTEVCEECIAKEETELAD